MTKKEIIFYGVIITASVMVALLFFVYFLIAIFSPITLAKGYNNINHNLSIKYYAKNYEKTNNSSDLYILVNKAVEFKKDKTIVKYYPMLEEDSKYDVLIEYVNGINYEQDGAVEGNVFRSNEDNRLKCRYVKALSTSDAEKAYQYAKDDLADVESRADLNFVYAGFSTVIDNVVELFDTQAVDDIIAYYNDIKGDFEDKKSTNNDYDNARYSYKALEICQFLLLLDQKEVEGIDATSMNADKIALSNAFQSYID